MPIPLYDPKDALHRKLAAAAEKAEVIAALVELKGGEHFTRTRKRIRAALIADGIADRIETLVAALIGSAPMLSITPDLSESDPDDTDAD